MGADSGEYTPEQLVGELARVFHDAGPARELVLQAGFPPGDLPVFDTPWVFWSRVIRLTTDGKLVGGLDAIVERAEAAFPGNHFFAAYRSSTIATSSSPERRQGQVVDHGNLSQPALNEGSMGSDDSNLSSSATQPRLFPWPLLILTHFGYCALYFATHLLGATAVGDDLEFAILRSIASSIGTSIAVVIIFFFTLVRVIRRRFPAMTLTVEDMKKEIYYITLFGLGGGLVDIVSEYEAGFFVGVVCALRIGSIDAEFRVDPRRSTAHADPDPLLEARCSPQDARFALYGSRSWTKPLRGSWSAAVNTRPAGRMRTASFGTS